MDTRSGVIWLDKLSDENGRNEVLVWDGRLDNREDLLLRLKDSLGSDTSNEALVLAAYERWGTSGFVHLIGDWSVVIRDAVNRRLVLASDFAGVRPLYYHLRRGQLFWSTRLQPLIDATGAEELDEKYFAGFVVFGGCPSRTAYREIQSVPPGHALCVSARETRICRFWELPVGDSIRYRDERRYEEQLRALFEEAVSVRLQTDKPAIAELSGGLDSSSVAGMANHLLRRGMVTTPRLASLSYVWRNSLDVPFINEVEEFCGIDGIRLSTENIPLLTETQAGGALPEGFVPLRMSAAAAASRLGAQVYLTGQNGDLIMGNWFDDSMQVAASLRRFHISEAFQEGIAWSKLLRTPVSGILWRAFRMSVSPAVASSFCVPSDSTFGAQSCGSSLLPAFRERTGLSEEATFFSNTWTEAPPERRKHFQSLTMVLELRSLQPPELLQHLDWTHPFAHRPLVEFLMTIPANVLCRPGQPRMLMRRALSDLWPVKLRSRRSKGLFNAPWLEALRPLALTLLAAPHIQVVERNIVDRTSFLSRLKRIADGLECNDAELRQILILEFWLRHRGLNRSSGATLQTIEEKNSRDYAERR